MREIKFRAWCRESVDNLSDLPNTNPYHLVEWNEAFFSDMSEVTRWGSDFPDPNDDDIILEQYTGLHDKNGKEIYEGDIVEITDLAMMECFNGAEYVPFKRKWVIEWSGVSLIAILHADELSKYGWYGNPVTTDIPLSGAIIEVIGNIHEVTP